MKSIDYKLLNIYCDETPQFIYEFVETEAMQRLKHIGMNCGTEYTAVYPNMQPLNITRFEHSVGAALIVWNFTHDVKQSVACLFHDISSPAFAHVVDYLNGDHMKQESTEELTTQIIDGDADIQRLLKKYGLITEDVCDYHIFPIADNDSPKLSADRLEYTMGDLFQYGYASLEDIAEYYSELCVAQNEFGEDEISFRSAKIAEEFALRSMNNSYVYIADSDRFTMQYLADLLKYANECGVVSLDDLYTTEESVVEKLVSNEATFVKWREYCGITGAVCATEPPNGKYSTKVIAKKRYLDPYVVGVGRVAEFSSEYKIEVEKFLSVSLDGWLSMA